MHSPGQSPEHQQLPENSCSGLRIQVGSPKIHTHIYIQQNQPSTASAVGWLDYLPAGHATLKPGPGAGHDKITTKLWNLELNITVLT